MVYYLNCNNAIPAIQEEQESDNDDGREMNTGERVENLLNETPMSVDTNKNQDTQVIARTSEKDLATPKSTTLETPLNGSDEVEKNQDAGNDKEIGTVVHMCYRPEKRYNIAQNFQLSLN